MRNDQGGDAVEGRYDADSHNRVAPVRKRSLLVPL